MKINMLALLGSAMLCAFLSSAQSNPPNDNFSDRIALNGDFILFTGILQGATREQNEIAPPFLSNSATQTVWWTWTPTQAETAIIQVLFTQRFARGNDAIAVYSLDSVSNGQFIAGSPIDSRMPEIFFSFHAEPGTNYQIQLAGTNSTSFFLRLMASNAPSIIIEQPRDQTVTVGDSALFTVLAAGVPPFGYQWQFNGTNLPGETVAMLGLDNCSSNQTGLYTAVISNAFGAITSAPAFLMVTETDTRPLLGPSRVEVVLHSR